MFRPFILSFSILILLISGCDRLSVKDNISDESFQLVNQKGEKSFFLMIFLAQYYW